MNEQRNTFFHGMHKEEARKEPKMNNENGKVKE